MSEKDSNSPAFATTHWSAVVAAGDSTREDSRAALAQLCRDYWYPLYVFVRKKGVAPQDAEDLTQGFFQEFLTKNQVARANPTRGRFRSFLVASLENYLRNQWRRRSAEKRGGGRAVLSLDVAQAEERYITEAENSESPETAYDRHWAATVLAKTLANLQAEWERDGRGDVFRALEAHLWGDPSRVPYSELQIEFNLTPVNLRVTFHRLRRRYRDLLRAAVSDTLADPAEVDDELRFLMRAVHR